MLTKIITGITALWLATGVMAADSESPTFQERIQSASALEGFFNLYWDEAGGQLLLEISDFDQSFIYQSSLPRGIGSNDIGLDRGQLGSNRLVRFERSGPKIFLTQENLDYRADSDDEAEIRAVEYSFAKSVIWGFSLIAESEGSVLVDATEFFLRDAHGISSWLSNAGQGSYSANASRSAIFVPQTRSFPDNTEIEAIVTFTGTPADGSAAQPSLLPTVVPDPTAITVHIHHSFIRLPDDDYQPLAYDPRAGLIGAQWGSGYANYASEIGTPLIAKNARRHRLERSDPTLDRSTAVEPIIYYVDPGAPEPVRSALIEGAMWWNRAFEAAGYIDAFQVKLLPPDADPMDVRYNVIQWVHRSTRGWSYGSSITDPRTGEILKGHVTLGSLRVRQDYLIAEGLLSPYADEEIPETMLEMSLARIRQLSAHEVGHTIGLEHNFAASADDRSSVMDYPFPLIKFKADGSLDLSDAYGVGIGAWDESVIRYAYTDFTGNENPHQARQAILDQTLASGLRFVADQDSRNPGSAHPLGNLWDNGEDAIAELEHLMKVRAYALSRFSEQTIRRQRPLATIEEALVPIFLLHRYQMQAVGKLLGGQTFNYQLRGDGQSFPETVDARRQRAALNALLALIQPETLKLPDALVASIPPRPPGFARDRESFARMTSTTFDWMAPAASATELVLEVLLHPARASRMTRTAAINPAQPAFRDVLEALVSSSWKSEPLQGAEGLIQRAVQLQVLNQIILSARGGAMEPVNQSESYAALRNLDLWLEKQNSGRKAADISNHYRYARDQINRFLNDPSDYTPLPGAAVPPGSPIGQ